MSYGSRYSYGKYRLFSLRLISDYCPLQVFLVWALDTAHQGLITHTAYTYLITHYADAAFLGDIVPSLMVRGPIICFLI